jgi:6-methylsalicylate decarboxylase
VPDPLGQLSRALYVDAVTTTSRPAFGAALEFFGADRIVFGSDCPYVPIAATAGGLRALDLATPTLEAIGAGNALSLLAARVP